MAVKLLGLDRFNRLGDVRERRQRQDAVHLERLGRASEATERAFRGLSDGVMAILSALASQYYHDGSYDGVYAPKWGVSPLERAISGIGRAANESYSSLLDSSLGFLKEETQRVFLAACHETQSDLGGWKSVSLMTEEQLSELANQRWFDGRRFSDRLWADRDALKRALFGTLTDGIAQGMGLEWMKAEFSKRLSAAEYAVERLIRTEYNRVQNQAILRAYTENGVRTYEYVAILDERTTETCESLNGKRFRVDSAEPGVNLPPMHPNCRSSTIPIGDGTTSVDRATERLDYEQWYERYVGS